jgi:hypothetical protein
MVGLIDGTLGPKEKANLDVELETFDIDVAEVGMAGFSRMMAYIHVFTISLLI